MPFKAWKCGDCGAHGQVKHAHTHTPADIGRLTAHAHAKKSPACHWKAQQTAAARAGLNPRDRHILVTARVKRKLVADALRQQRQKGRDTAELVWCERWDVKRDSLTRTEKLLAWGAVTDVIRKNWLAGQQTRKGYAFT